MWQLPRTPIRRSSRRPWSWRNRTGNHWLASLFGRSRVRRCRIFFAHRASVNPSARTADVDWIALGLSVRLALLVAAILLILGPPIAYWLTFSQWRWKFVVEAIVALPLVLPPTVLGFYLLV